MPTSHFFKKHKSDYVALPLLDHFLYGKFTQLVLACLLPIVAYICDMKRILPLMSATTLVLVFIMSSTYGQSAGVSAPEVLGAGNLSCRVVLKNTEDKGLRKFYENWAQGWISAANNFSDLIGEGMKTDRGKSISGEFPLPTNIVPRRDVIWYKILGYCSEEPKAKLSDAVKDLLKSQWNKAQDK